MKFYSKKLKKFFAMICAFFLIVEFSLSGIPVKAAETEPKITYTVTGEATVGKQITINLNVSNISGLYGGSWDFAYDPNVIRIDEITAGDLISSIPQTTISSKSGHAYFWFTKTGDTTGVSTTEAKSIAKIKATVLKEGTVKIDTTDNDNFFGVNNKSSLVKLSDKNGDKITYSSEDKSISCAKPITILSPGTYEESNSAFKYNGTWKNESSNIYSQQKGKYSLTKDDSVEFYFNGRGFDLISATAPSGGKANLYVDNVLVSTIDFYSPNYNGNQLLFSTRSLDSGTHLVKLEVLGTKNPSSKNTLVTFDKVIISK